MSLYVQQKTPLVVLIAGWAGSGKDTAAALLIDELGFERLAFADALKADVAERTGLSLAVFHSARKNEPLGDPIAAFPGAQTPRDCLIARAAVVRAADPDAYARIVAAAIGTAGRYVITDWRYRNEYAVLQQTLPTSSIILCVRIVRTGLIPSADPSEHDLDGIAVDVTVQNDGSMSDLRDAMKAAIRNYIRVPVHLLDDVACNL